ncbi:hypothetical protein [Pseudonocardia sp.]|jgi:hypothetical protein|uniref:hypothetical protein n=1 Tax=Pseudonocardia sp. TaxID=60912 RepID=UPI0031FE0C2E
MSNDESGIPPGPATRVSLGAIAREWTGIVYALVGGAAAATVGPYLVLVLLACGMAETRSETALTASKIFISLVR